MSRILALTLILLTAACAASPSEPPQPVSTAEIQSFLDAFAAAARTGDADTISAMYAEDVRILEDGRLAYSSRSEVREAIAAFPVQGEVTLNFAGTDILVLSESAALIQTAFEQRFESNGWSFGGAISMLLTREDDAWLIKRSHTSTGENRGEEG